MPAPSSAIAMMTCEPACRADSEIRPAGDLPARRLASGSSMPWSTALRTRCVSGSSSSSRIRLSISVSSPVTVSSTSLCWSRARSRTLLGTAANTVRSGTMRVPITSSCSASSTLPVRRSSDASCSTVAASRSSASITIACREVTSSGFERPWSDPVVWPAREAPKARSQLRRRRVISAASVSSSRRRSAAAAQVTVSSPTRLIARSSFSRLTRTLL